MPSEAANVVTVIEATYFSSRDDGLKEFIALWYQESGKVMFILFPLARTDLLSLEQGDKGKLERTQSGGWEFVPRGH